jgi:hypothetical protein
VGQELVLQQFLSGHAVAGTNLQHAGDDALGGLAESGVDEVGAGVDAGGCVFGVVVEGVPAV